ncbi:MAG: hypothetical protein HQ523_04905 [Lentisphaerae bacterium]|nr:hypothetical protein [Lentisphaerota bacterium]
MNISVGGVDRSADLGQSIEAMTAELTSHPASPKRLAEGHSALFLRSAADERDYLRILLSLLVAKCGASVEDFDVPHRPGRLGAIGGALRRALWKLLRYQHERMTTQQNLIRSYMTAAMEMMHQEQRRELDECRARLAALEAAAGEAPHAH